MTMVIPSGNTFLKFKPDAEKSCKFASNKVTCKEATLADGGKTKWEWKLGGAILAADKYVATLTGADIVTTSLHATIE